MAMQLSKTESNEIHFSMTRRSNPSLLRDHKPNDREPEMATRIYPG
jgi:hypothetical protein